MYLDILKYYDTFNQPQTWAVNNEFSGPDFVPVFVKHTLLNYLAFQSFDFESYYRKASCALNLISRLYYYHLVDTPAGGLLVPEGVFRQVVSGSTLAWFTDKSYIRNALCALR